MISVGGGGSSKVLTNCRVPLRSSIPLPTSHACGPSSHMTLSPRPLASGTGAADQPWASFTMTTSAGFVWSVRGSSEARRHLRWGSRRCCALSHLSTWSGRAVEPWPHLHRGVSRGHEVGHPIESDVFERCLLPVSRRDAERGPSIDKGPTCVLEHGQTLISAHDQIGSRGAGELTRLCAVDASVTCEPPRRSCIGKAAGTGVEVEVRSLASGDCVARIVLDDARVGVADVEVGSAILVEVSGGRVVTASANVFDAPRLRSIAIDARLGLQPQFVGPAVLRRVVRPTSARDAQKSTRPLLSKSADTQSCRSGALPVTGEYLDHLRVTVASASVP